LKKAKQIQPPKDQVAAFRKAARELGCDESEDRFRDALRTVAKHKPQSRPSKRRKGT
jgi:hypothetical protein